MNDKFDDIFFSILKEVKTVPNFFDVVFGFLYRKTDFYHIAQEHSVGVGLPPGVAEGSVKKAFLKYSHINKIIEKGNVTTELDVAKEVEVKTTKESNISSTVNKKPSTMDSYNGASYENYSWSQTISDVDIQVKIPENLTSKQLSVNITSNKVAIKVKNSDTVVLEGDFCNKCKHQETIWSIDCNVLQIHLEKVQEIWWNCLLTTENKLDLSKMDCTRPFHELSEEAQAKIEELTWNQERKRQGLLTSDQLPLEETLIQAWNAEGSPFTGKYDPSKVRLG